MGESVAAYPVVTRESTRNDSDDVIGVFLAAELQRTVLPTGVELLATLLMESGDVRSSLHHHPRHSCFLQQGGGRGQPKHRAVQS